jgi:long-chain acyl-CoA synthetase
MKSIPALFEESVAKYPNNTYVLEKRSELYKPITYNEIKERVYNLAFGFLDLGFEKNDKVVLLSEGRSEWLISELAILYTAAIDVPVSVKINESEDLLFRINHSESKYIVVSAFQLHKIRKVKDKIENLKKIIVIGEIEELEKNEIYYSELLENGLELKDKYADELEKRWKSIKNDDVANISYTSGTTADPKGIMLTHRNYTANVEQAGTLLHIPEYYSSLLILPWDHSFGHTVGLYTLMKNGASLSVVETGKSQIETLKNIPKNIKETKPTFILSVPALAKNFKKNIENGIKEKKADKLFNFAIKIAYLYNAEGYNKGKGLRFLLKPLYSLFDKILFSKIRENFGGKLEFFIGGGALLDIELQRFFYAIGIPMFQGYGLSESAPIISSNTPNRHKLGSSGFLVKPLELKICDEDGNELTQGEKGEIVVKGENVMIGYWKNEKATSETLKDGWLYTGDLGYMDKDGFLYVLGRYKSLLIANDGEKYSPEGIEETIAENSKYIDQILLHNNQNPYTVALIVPNFSALKSYAANKKLDLNQEKDIKVLIEIIDEEINQYFRGGKHEGLFPERWLPTSIGILSEAFTEQNRMLNSTMKVVRRKVEDYYKDKIEFLYSGDSKNPQNSVNIKAIKDGLN